MRRLLTAAVAIIACLTMPGAARAEEQYPFCAPGEIPAFAHGFASLRAEIGDEMGEPVECEHRNSTSGDTLQATTTGLAIYRKRIGAPTFTDGRRHWALVAEGLVSWEGASFDPPGTAGAGGPEADDTRSMRAYVWEAIERVNAFWQQEFASQGLRYQIPSVAWVKSVDALPTGCGSIVVLGPAYCGGDRVIYLVEPFFEELWIQDFDFGVAVVVAHEWGHHVQRLVPEIAADIDDLVHYELQADCLAGRYAAYAREQGWLDEGDAREAVVMALHFGDEDHGTGEERAQAFLAGYRGSSCIPG